MKMTAQEYARRVRRIGPHSPLGLDCLWAFGVGGGICLLGEVLRQRYLAMGVEADLAGTLTSCSLIVLSAVLTTLGWYQKLAAKAGAGSLVPITGLCQCGGQRGHRVQGRGPGAGHRGQDVHHRRAGDRIRHAGGGGVRRGAVGAGHGWECPSFVINTGKCAVRLQHDVIIQHFMERFPSIFHEGEILPMTVRCGDTLLFQTPPVIAAGAAVGGKKRGRRPAGGRVRRAERRQPLWPVQLGSCGKIPAAACRTALPAKAALPAGKGAAGPCRGSAGPVHGIQLCHAGAGRALCRAVRGLQHHGRGAGAGGCSVRGRCCAQSAGHGFQPLLRGRAAVPHAAELRRGAHAHGPVDCHRCRMLPSAAAGRRRWHCRCHLWPCAGLSGKGHQQYGAAMAPAAASTLLHYFKDTGTEPQEFDCIYTGDLGQTGSQLLRELLAAEGLLDPEPCGLRVHPV